QVRVQQLELNGILNLPKHLFADLLSRQGLSEPAGSDSLRIRIPDKRRAAKHVKQDRVRGLRPDPSDLKQPAAEVGGVFRTVPNPEEEAAHLPDRRHFAPVKPRRPDGRGQFLIRRLKDGIRVGQAALPQSPDRPSGVLPGGPLDQHASQAPKKAIFPFPPLVRRQLRPPAEKFLPKQAPAALWRRPFPPYGLLVLLEAACRTGRRGTALPSGTPVQGATTRFERVPMPSMVISTSSPGVRGPTPLGVPVRITSPGS